MTKIEMSKEVQNTLWMGLRCILTSVTLATELNRRSFGHALNVAKSTIELDEGQTERQSDS